MMLLVSGRSWVQLSSRTQNFLSEFFSPHISFNLLFITQRALETWLRDAVKSCVYSFHIMWLQSLCQPTNDLLINEAPCSSVVRGSDQRRSWAQFQSWLVLRIFFWVLLSTYVILSFMMHLKEHKISWNYRKWLHTTSSVAILQHYLRSTWLLLCRAGTGN